jgi:hypothetical protein
VIYVATMLGEQIMESEHVGEGIQGSVIKMRGVQCRYLQRSMYLLADEIVHVVVVLNVMDVPEIALARAAEIISAMLYVGKNNVAVPVIPAVMMQGIVRHEHPLRAGMHTQHQIKTVGIYSQHALPYAVLAAAGLGEVVYVEVLCQQIGPAFSMVRGCSEAVTKDSQALHGSTRDR